MKTKTILWIIGIIIILGIIGNLVSEESPQQELKLGEPIYPSNTESSSQTENELVPISTESSSSKTSEEETCDYGFSDKKRCDGKVIEHEWISSDCSSSWSYIYECSYDCEDGKCIYESTEDEEEIQEPEEQSDYFKVTYIVDGDTLDINTGERVRLICIDTPERGEYYYSEAKDYLKSLTLNNEVDLVKDISETDKYERLLRYIYLTDGTFVNELIVKNGYAKAYPYSPDTTLCPQIEEAEDYAKENNLGIWADEESEEETSSEGCTSNFYNCGDFSSCSEVM